MFSFTKRNGIFELSFKNELMSFSCVPEYPTHFNSLSFDCDDFSFYFIDGEFSISFNEKNITFEDSKLTLTVNMTDEIKKSLDEALIQWKKALEKEQY
jgi:hypothetical protein